MWRVSRRGPDGGAAGTSPERGRGHRAEPGPGPRTAGGPPPGTRAPGQGQNRTTTAVLWRETARMRPSATSRGATAQQRLFCANLADRRAVAVGRHQGEGGNGPGQARAREGRGGARASRAGDAPPGVRTPLPEAPDPLLDIGSLLRQDLRHGAPAQRAYQTLSGRVR